LHDPVGIRHPNQNLLVRCGGGSGHHLLRTVHWHPKILTPALGHTGQLTDVSFILLRRLRCRFPASAAPAPGAHRSPRIGRPVRRTFLHHRFRLRIRILCSATSGPTSISCISAWVDTSFALIRYGLVNRWRLHSAAGKTVPRVFRRQRVSAVVLFPVLRRSIMG